MSTPSDQSEPIRFGRTPEQADALFAKLIGVPIDDWPSTFVMLAAAIVRQAHRFNGDPLTLSALRRSVVVRLLVARGAIRLVPCESGYWVLPGHGRAGR